MKNALVKLAGLILLIVGLFNIYSGIFGRMWHDPDFAPYLGWLQWYVLRPALLISGPLGALCGAWLLLPVRWRRTVLLVVGDEIDDEVYDAKFWDATWATTGLRKSTAWNRLPRIARHLWGIRACFVGRHPADSLWFCRGGEDGMRGTVCCDCGERLSRDNIVPKQDRSYSRGDVVYDSNPGGHNWSEERFTSVQPDPFRAWPEEDRQ